MPLKSAFWGQSKRVFRLVCISLSSARLTQSDALARPVQPPSDWLSVISAPAEEWSFGKGLPTLHLMNAALVVVVASAAAAAAAAST